jgi:hypothetical protein
MVKSKDQRYVVAPGVSFVGNKRAYVAGDEIDESAFSDPKYFKAFLSGKSPKIIPAPPEPEEEPDKKNGKKKETGENLGREVLIEKLIASGLFKTKEELASLAYKELVELLEISGIK